MASPVALVTGGTRGVGLAIARRLQAEGCCVVAVYLENDNAAAQCEADYGVLPFRCDVRDAAETARTIHLVGTRVGAIDIIVNNVGSVRNKLFHEMDEACWRKSVDSVLHGAFNVTRPVINGMRDRRFGRIINISAIAAQRGEIGKTHFATSKAALLGFTRALALESAASGITVNAVAALSASQNCESGLILNSDESGFAPVGRAIGESDVAMSVAFLARRECDFITGTCLTLAGGEHIPL